MAAGSAQAVAVTPGRALRDALEITGVALEPGDKLVLSPGEKMRSGDKLTVSGKQVASRATRWAVRSGN